VLSLLRRANEGAHDPHAELLDEGRLSLLHGEFVTARARLASAEELVRSEPDESAHADAALYDAWIREEEGDVGGAARAALEFLRRRDLFRGNDPTVPIFFAPIAVRGGAVSRSDALAMPLVPRGASPEADPELAEMRVVLRLALASDPASAREVLSELAGRTPRLSGGGLDDEIGYQLARARELAGDLDGAIGAAEPVVRTCFWDGTRNLRAALILGRAREAKGDTAGACEAYARVLSRWGSAKPRSVTADAARARAVHCPR
jgi:hypothetical protein